MLVNSLEVIILARICSNLLIMLLLINFKRIIKTGSDCVKSRSLGQLTQKACKPYRNHIFNPNPSSYLLRMLVLVKSRTCMKIRSNGFKSRSLGQIIEKACNYSKSHSFAPNLLKLTQNVSLGQL